MARLLVAFGDECLHSLCLCSKALAPIASAGITGRGRATVSESVPASRHLSKHKLQRHSMFNESSESLAGHAVTFCVDGDWPSSDEATGVGTSTSGASHFLRIVGICHASTA